MSTATLGRMIKQRRAAFNLSEEDVACLSGLSVESLRLVEQGAQLPTAFELSRIADALAVDPAALWRGDASNDDPARGTVRFLAGPGLDGLSARDHRLLARAADVGRVGRFLWDLLDKGNTPLLELRTVTPITSEAEPWRQGYELGEAARSALADVNGPLESVQGLLEDLGVHVATVEFDVSDVIAASLTEPGALPVILLNRSHNRVKYPIARRSVLAHELCHLLHDGTSQHIVSVVSRQSQENEAVEQRANGFGPSFLAPGSRVEVVGGDHRRVVESLASEWLLSWEGACWHAKNLSLIPPHVAWDLRPTRGWSAPQVPKEEPGRTPMNMVGVETTPEPLVQGLISELVAQAVIDGEIGRGRAREILSIR